MDIAKLSIDIASSQVARDFNIGLLRMNLDQVSQVGEQIVDLINTISIDQPSTIDIQV